MTDKRANRHTYRNEERQRGKHTKGYIYNVPQWQTEKKTLLNQRKKI